MGSKSSSSQSSNVTNQYDQRAITTIDDRDVFSSYDLSDRSTNTSSYDLSDRSSTSLDASNRSTSNVSTQLDASNRSTYSDSSNRSVSTTINATDPGAVRLGELNAQLLGAVAESQSDAVKTLAGFGAGAVKDAGTVFTSAFGANERAWSHTVDASENVITKLLAGAKDTTDASRALATAAISAYQPADSKLGDAVKWGAIAVAVVGGFLLFRRPDTWTSNSSRSRSRRTSRSASSATAATSRSSPRTSRSISS